MRKYTTVAGLCMLSALLVGAFAAQSASAVTKGTTAFTCVTDAAGTFKGDHCLTTGSASPSKHVAIAEETTTKTTTTNANTASETTASEPGILKITIAGTPLEMVASVTVGEGSLTNKKAASGEHYIHATGTLTATNVEVTKPEGKECRVFTDNNSVKGEEGVIHTVPLTATTEGQGDSLKIQPNEGTTFGTFFIECNNEVPEAIQGTYTVTGSLKCPINGATILCNHTEMTTQNTLKVKGAKAGIEGALTLKGRHPGLDPEGTYNPITATTVETP